VSYSLFLFLFLAPEEPQSGAGPIEGCLSDNSEYPLPVCQVDGPTADQASRDVSHMQVVVSTNPPTAAR
jgi:hypothetical protein